MWCNSKWEGCSEAFGIRVCPFEKSPKEKTVFSFLDAAVVHCDIRICCNVHLEPEHKCKTLMLAKTKNKKNLVTDDFLQWNINCLWNLSTSKLLYCVMPKSWGFKLLTLKAFKLIKQGLKSRFLSQSPCFLWLGVLPGWALLVHNHFPNSWTQE